MALLAPMIWAVACLIDSCLVGERLYVEPFDGVTVSCLFSLFPLTVFTLTHRVRLNTETDGNFPFLRFLLVWHLLGICGAILRLCFCLMMLVVRKHSYH